MNFTSNNRGFALLTAVIFGVIFSLALAGLYVLSRSLGKTSTLYAEVDSAEAANRSAANVAAEVIKSVILDHRTPSGGIVTEPDLLTHDLSPSSSARWDDDPILSPDLTIVSGSWTSYVDIDYIPLASGFSWTDIEFGTAYHKSSAGSSSMGAQTYKVRVITMGPGNKRLDSEGIYVLKMK